MRRNWLIIGILITITILTFARVGKLGFVNYDDPDYITANPIVQRGVSPEGLAWAFGQIHGSETYWHPITWLTHMLDCQVFGLNSAGHHLVSLAFHTANVLLLFVLLSRATGAFWTSAVVAALFAVHPFQVESVAWITERKNLVSTFFALLTLLAYVKFTQRRTVRWYVLSLVLFALALMSKPAVVTLPCVMLLMDFWPLCRFSLFTVSGRFAPSQLLQSKTLFLEKIPFFVLSAASAILTITAHQQLGMLVAESLPPVALNYGNIVVSYFEYVRKFFWPSDLAAFYPFPMSLSFGTVLGCFLILALVTLVCVIRLKRQPFLMIGWLWFLGVMVPMTGIVHVGIQAMADRFMYVPIIGLLVMVCFTAKEVLARSRKGPKLAVIGSVVALLSCISISRAQVNYWKNDFALFEHARQVTKNNYMAYTAVASVYVRQGQFDAAMTNLQIALEIQPSFAEAHFTRGFAMLYKGRFPDAINEFEEALRTRPRYYEARFGLAATYQRMGNIDAALTNFQETVRLKPDLAAAHRALGDMLLAKGRFRDALAEFRDVLLLDPSSVEVLGRTAWLLATHADPTVRNGPEAVRLAEKACQLTGYAQAQPLNALAAAYAEVGKFDLAANTQQKALEIARANNQANLVPMTETLLKLYQSGKPYHEEEH